jgi:release factor glutamine methyltransferase
MENTVGTLELLNTLNNNLKPEGEWLLSSILGCNRIDLYIGNKNVSKEEIGRFNQMFEDILNGRPIQYILGKTEFMGLEFIVNPDVFIPRPETEILVEKVIEIVQSLKFKVRSILDIGTGSGCIAISLAKFLKNVEVTATDISNKALEIAKQNALLNNVEINFLQSNLFTNYKLRTTNYELIVSNPPYIPTGELKDLPKEVKFEPTVALDGGRDGLDFYRYIINEARYYLKYKGYLIMEVEQGQVPEIQKIFKNSNPVRNTKFNKRNKISNRANQSKLLEAIKDYRGIERVIVAQWIS